MCDKNQSESCAGPNVPNELSYLYLFQILEVLGGIFHFIQKFSEYSVSNQWRP